MRHFLIALCLVLLTSCGHEPLYQSQTYVFGTLVDISIYGENNDRAHELASHIEQEFQRLHESLHAWKTGSDLDRLNTAFATGKPADVSPELEKLITGATAVANQSNDLFNPAIGHLIQLWGFQRDEFLPVNPSTAEIGNWVTANPRMADITIHDHQASSSNPAVKLDLGGYAKGYALDIASAYLRQNKVHGALINIGGNIIAVGSHGQRPWRVGIQHPRNPARLPRWNSLTAGPSARLGIISGFSNVTASVTATSLIHAAERLLKAYKL